MTRYQWTIQGTFEFDDGHDAGLSAVSMVPDLPADSELAVKLLASTDEALAFHITAAGGNALAYLTSVPGLVDSDGFTISLSRAPHGDRDGDV
jgi:hypothetical protein